MNLLLIAIFIGFSLLVLVLVIRHIEANSIFFPMKGTPLIAGDAMPHDEIHFDSTDGKKLHGWYIPSNVANADAPVVLFLHGNAGNIGHRWEKLGMLHRL